MSIYRSSPVLAGIALLTAAVASFGAPEVRIKDIAYISGARENQLVGIGVVTGLAGNGDSSSSALLRNTLSNLIARFGLEVPAAEIRSRNAAVVMLSAEIPAFARAGDRVDVTVSSVADARSLEGGVLLQAPLRAANGQSYAVAQGQLLTSTDRRGVRTVGTVPSGAIVERDVVTDFVADGLVSLILRDPDFSTTSRVAAVIREAFPDITVRPLDASRVDVQLPDDAPIVSTIAGIEALVLIPDSAGRVVVDSRSGIVVSGEAVRIANVAVAYRSTQVNVGFVRQRPPTTFEIPDIATVGDLVATLQGAQVPPDSIIGILRAIDRAGALFGILVVL